MDRRQGFRSCCSLSSSGYEALTRPKSFQPAFEGVASCQPPALPASSCELSLFVRLGPHPKRFSLGGFAPRSGPDAAPSPRAPDSRAPEPENLNQPCDTRHAPRPIVPLRGRASADWEHGHRSRTLPPGDRSIRGNMRRPLGTTQAGRRHRHRSDWWRLGSARTVTRRPASRSSGSVPSWSSAADRADDSSRAQRRPHRCEQPLF